MSSCRQGYADTSSRASLRPQARPQRVRSPLLGRGRKAGTPKDPNASGLAGSPANGLHRPYPPSGKVAAPDVPSTVGSSVTFQSMARSTPGCLVRSAPGTAYESPVLQSHRSRHDRPRCGRSGRYCGRARTRPAISAAAVLSASPASRRSSTSTRQPDVAHVCSAVARLLRATRNRTASDLRYRRSDAVSVRSG